MVGVLEQRALTAAGAVAATHGLSVRGAALIHSESNVLVHLRPAPVVARVMTGTVALHDDPKRWLEREISVLAFLKPSGLAVAPSRLIAPGPHQRDGLWMTFTERVADARLATDLNDPCELGRILRDLHDELRSFEGELGDLGELLGRIYVGSLRGHGASPTFVRAVLSGYGWNDEDELAPFLEAQDVYDEIWRIYDRQRRRS